jgi:hypothetical protein
VSDVDRDWVRGSLPILSIFVSHSPGSQNRRASTVVSRFLVFENKSMRRIILILLRLLIYSAIGSSQAA